MEITTLIENLVYKQGLVSEHGLSFFIDYKGCRILFDTGQTGKFIDNAVELGIDLRDIDYVIFSHGHYDHTGGLEELLKINKTAKIIMKKEAFESKYSKSSGKMREIGFVLKEKLENYENEIILLDEDFKLNDSIKIITEIKKRSRFEDNESKLFVKSETGYEIDPFNDELFLVIEKNDKINIITGCSHNGIINTIKTAIEKTENSNIGCILGGTHLKGKTEEVLGNTIEELQKIDFEKLYTNHCTGIDRYCELKKVFGDKIAYSHTGYKFEI